MKRAAAGARRRREVTPAKREPGGLLAAYGLHCADEALSALRHDVLNRMTAVGALSYELRRCLGLLEEPAPGGEENPAATARQRLEDLNRQIGLLAGTVGRRLARPAAAGSNASLGEALLRLRPLYPGPSGHQVPLVVTAPRSLRLEIDVEALALVLFAVLDNARRASLASRERRPTIELVGRLDQEGQAVLQVDDRGPGLRRPVRERAFERFFTTSPGRAGLGLCVAHSLVLRAGGEISLSTRPGGGARVLISLPSAAGARRGRA